MKKIKIKKIIKLLIISVIISFFQLCFTVEKPVYSASVSKAECVIDIETKRVLFSVNSNEKLPLASTTKILTALTVIENFNVDKIVTVPKKATLIEGSSVYLREGEKLTVLELLYGLMLRSGNDCAETLSLTLTDKKEDFISLINQTAKKCGAVNSNFTNAHGLHDINHYTTAYDLALISASAMKNELFRKIVSTKKIEISNDGYDYKRVLINKNKMLSTVEGATGIKTGFTKKAGRCLVSSVKKCDAEYISVVLNSPDMWNRSTELLNNAFSTYKMVKIFDNAEFFERSYKTKKGKTVRFLTEKSFYYPITKNEANSVEFKIDGVSVEEFALKNKSEGEFQIFIQNQLIFSQKLYSIYNR